MSSIELLTQPEVGITILRCARTRWAMMRLVIRSTKPLGLTFEQFLLVAAALTPNDLHMSWKRPSKMLIRHAQR